VEGERERERERNGEKRALCVNGWDTTGETTAGIQPWTTNSLINQIPVCRTNGRANIEQPVSGTPRGIKVQGISEKRVFFFQRGRFHPLPARRSARRRNDFRRAGRGVPVGKFARYSASFAGIIR